MSVTTSPRGSALVLGRAAPNAVDLPRLQRERTLSPPQLALFSSPRWAAAAYWRDRWLRPGRGTMPTTPHHLETRALAATLDRVAAHGLDAAVRRHRRARDAARAGLRALGFSPYVAADDEAASVATVATLPPATGQAGPARLLAAAAASSHAEGTDDSWLIAGPAFGSLADRALRLNHTGPGAALAPVLATLAYLGYALPTLGRDADVSAALAAAAVRWKTNADGSAPQNLA